MSAGRRRVRASFWLLDASDSLMVQSRREPDGTGLGYFDAGGHPVVDKQAAAAYDNASFSSTAREAELGDYRDLVAGDTDSERFSPW